jgi:hypothetical protein
MRPGLTLLCITKDQAGKLMRMLQSVQGVVDDIVVFDTGSKDLSLGIAKTLGARVFQIEWPGSFSEAINKAMREVQTQWTLRLDTDEWLLPESGPQVRRLLDDTKAFAYHLLRQDLSDEVTYSESWHLRLWRTDSRLRMQGFIHEFFPDHLLEQAAGSRQIFRAPARFRHDGFVGGSTEEKHRRNIELLRKELVARPGQLYYEIELVMTMLVLREQGGDELLRQLTDRVMDAKGKPEPLVASLMGTALTELKRRELTTPRAEAILEYSWRWFDACPPLLWAIAQAELRRGNPAGIYRALSRLEQLSESGEYEREWTFDARILGEHLWGFLTQIAADLGEEEVANRNRERLVARPRL